jgi:Divergent InlB B-repeat domain
MLLRYRSYLTAAFAVVCVLLCTSSTLRAEDDDEDHVIVALTAAEKAQTQALNSQPVQTVPLSTQGIAPSEYNGDVRNLPPALVPRYLHTWNEFEEPLFLKTPLAAGSAPSKPSIPPVRSAPMPSPLKNFPGLSFGTTLTGGNAGAGWPPDTNGDVGPVYYIQAVNDAWGIFDKTTGTMVAGFTEDQLWSTATTGTPCDANNFGDPVAIHDGVADRWVLTDFAFGTDLLGNPVAPFYQCFAVSKSGDPVAGGWYLYAVQMDTGTTGAPPSHTFTDYPKFGFWTDCLYMGANGFNNDSGNYAGSVFAAFDRTALFSGAALSSANSSVGFISSDTSFGLFPANLQGTSAGSQPPPGTPEYFVAESGTDYAFDVRKFQKGATACGAGSTLSGITSVSQASYDLPYTASGNTNIVSQPSVTRKLDSLADELMQRVVYRKLGSAESLWVVHTTCGAGTANCPAATPTSPQWAQIDVSGGTINTTPVQQQIYTVGDGLHRWMGSIAVDAQGNMAIGYDTSGTTAPNFPSIAYSGRLVTDALNQLPQTEVQMAAGLGSQNTCGAGCGGLSRWGDYSAMVIDPTDDCTFWYTNMYYAAASHTTGAKWDTQIGSFKFPGCDATVTTYTVTASVSGGHGTISPASQPVNAGATATFAVTPNSSYHIASVTGDTCTVSNTSGATWTSSAINQDCAVTATFAIDTFTVTASVNGSHGTIAPPSQSVNSGDAATFTVMPDVGYHVISVIGSTCTPTQGTGTTWTAANITANCAVTATFEADVFTVTTSVSSGGGTATPLTQTVNAGASAAFTIIPAIGSHVQLVQGDTCTVSNTSGTTWTSSAIHADCAVSVTFAANTLVFTQQPGDLLRGSVLGTIQVTEEDGSNNPVDDNATVTFSIAACNGTIELGSVQMVHGVATLSSTQVFYTAASALHIGASAGALSGISQDFAVTTDPDLLFADGFESCRL